MDNLEWRAKVHVQVDDVLAMIRNRNNPDNNDFPGTAWFETKEEAELYAFTNGLSTGRQYTVSHRESIADSVYSTVRDILKGKE